MPDQGEKDDDRDWHPEEPKQNPTAHSDLPKFVLKERQWSLSVPSAAAGASVTGDAATLGVALC